MSQDNRGYIVVEAGDPIELKRKVMELLRDGCRLQGGVAVVATGDDSYLYAQAMTFDTVVD